ncbi:MAG TPA: TonB-dependent receptor [Steroidobacteraceae bacterium]|nr:TonB-dependent receptor [Steroidobacteraceae bacterium]
MSAVIAGPTLVLAGGVAMPAQAQAPQTPVVADASADTGSGLQEIVITAQKRAENLQSVPVSVTALTAGQLAETKMDTPSALATQIPNLQVGGVNGEGSPIFSLRGVSMFDYSLNQSSPVASYIDEVYKGNVVLFGVEMFDLERVEVLRGPQGTLYGKNSTGGAINFITRDPTFDTEADLKVGMGNYARREAEGTFQTALIPDRLAVRVAATYTKVGGFMENVLPGYPNMEGVRQWGTRVTFLLNITDDLTAHLRLSKSKQDPIDYAIIAGNIAPGVGVGGLGYYRTADGTATGAPLANDQVAQNYTPDREQSNEAAELTLDWKLNSAYALKSITSWDEGSLFNPDNTDGAPLNIFKIPYYGSTRQVTQDLRVTSTLGGPFEFIAGAYYQHEMIYNSTENQLYNLDTSDYTTCEDASFGAGQGYNIGSLLNAGCRYYNRFDQIRNSWAAYTDGSYALSSLVKLRAGLRYTHENAIQKNALDQLRGSDDTPIANLGFFSEQAGPAGPYYGPTLALPGTPGYDALVNQTRSQSLHNTAATGHAGIDFTPTKDSLIYLSYSRGFRAGAFNAQFLFSPNDFTTVRPETVDSVEAGFKTAWFDNRLQVNGAIFHYQYKNQQIVDVRPDGEQPLINLPKSKIDGGELEIITRPVRSLTLRAGLGFLNAKVQDGAVAGGTVSVSGHKLPEAPDVSGTVAADWVAFVVPQGNLTLHLDSSFASKQYFELVNEDRIAQQAYGLLNGRLTWHGPDDRWDVGLWSNNLTDRFYLTNAYDLQALGFDYLHRGLPREFGVDASYHFR